MDVIRHMKIVFLVLSSYSLGWYERFMLWLAKLQTIISFIFYSVNL